MVVYDSVSDSYKFYAMCSSNGTNRVLDISTLGGPLLAGNNVQIWTPIDPPVQLFDFQPLVSTGYYHIRMANNTNLYVTSNGSGNGTADGRSATSEGNIYLNTFDIALNQQWYLVLLEDESPAPATPEQSRDYIEDKGYTYSTNYSDNCLIEYKNSDGMIWHYARVDNGLVTAKIGEREKVQHSDVTQYFNSSISGYYTIN